jgi:predicted phosphodiesterase
VLRRALISDIHGNTVALDAVLADGDEQGITEWWVLGDLAAIGVEPAETLERLANLRDARFVRGNTDRYTVTGERPFPHPEDLARDESLRELFDAVESSFAWTRDALTPQWHAWLAALPVQQRTTLADGTRLLGVHASPESDDGRGIQPSLSDDDLTELLAGADADVVCGGHTHRPTDRRIGAMRAINLGSVSNPITPDLRASYVLVADDAHGHSLTHRRVAYDHDEVLARIRSSSHPQAGFLASFQRGEQVRENELMRLRPPALHRRANTAPPPGPADLPPG